MDDVVADWIYAPSHSFLDSFCDVLEPNQVPLMKRGHFGTYNPLTDRSKLDHKEQIREDLILLMELLPEFCFLAKYKIQLLDTDEFTRGLKKMALTKKIPVWLTFATTIFLDVHHILRETVTTAFTELNTIGKTNSNHAGPCGTHVNTQSNIQAVLTRYYRSPHPEDTNPTFSILTRNTKPFRLAKAKPANLKRVCASSGRSYPWGCYLSSEK